MKPFEEIHREVARTIMKSVNRGDLPGRTAAVAFDALAALGIDVRRIAAGELKVLPKQPTERMWGGLARDIMMAIRMSAMTPRNLFQHLNRVGRDVPQWLRDEDEMKALDHVPSKGTHVTIIYKAMWDAAP